MPNDAQASVGGSKKWIYIIGGIVIVLVLLGFFARTAGFMAMHAAGVNVQQGPNGSVQYNTAQGSVTVGGTSMPDNWPSDLPANYTGATIEYAGSSNPQTGSAGGAVMYTVNAPAATVVAYYKAELAKDGWAISGSAQSSGTTVISATKDTRTAGVSVADEGSGATQVTIGVSLQ